MKTALTKIVSRCIPLLLCLLFFPWARAHCCHVGDVPSINPKPCVRLLRSVTRLGRRLARIPVTRLHCVRPLMFAHSLYVNFQFIFSQLVLLISSFHNSLCLCIQCTNGYTASGGKCVCNGHVCNGKCQTSKCPVATRGFSNRKRQASCPTGYSMCGIAGLQDVDTTSAVLRATNGDSSQATNRRPYECIETRSNIESCECL